MSEVYDVIVIGRSLINGSIYQTFGVITVSNQ